MAVGLAILSSILAPLFFRWLDKKRREEEARKSKAERTEKEFDDLVKQLVQQQLSGIDGSVEELSKQLKEIKEALTKLDRSHLERLSSCQKTFVSAETYKNDLKTQKYYYKLIYGMVQQQLGMLSRSDSLPPFIDPPDSED